MLFSSSIIWVIIFFLLAGGHNCFVIEAV